MTDTVVAETSPTHDPGLTRKSTSLFEPAIVRRAILDSFTKLNPRTQARNPVMFVVLIGSVWTTVLFFRSVGFDIGNSDANDRISVAASYKDRELLRSGWLDGEKHLVRRPALLDVGYGKGRIALIGFRAQNRAQAYGTFKVLFNAIYQAGAVDVAGSR